MASASASVSIDVRGASDTTTISGLYEFEELHVHEGKTLVLLPGAELVRRDVPPADPAHADGGIVVHGHLRAVRAPGEPPIVIRSANPSGHRGHLMVHGTAELDGVEVRDFGRTTNAKLDATANPIARYAVHWHLAGDASRGSRIENCLVHDTAPRSNRRHGIVVHGSNGVTVRNNIVRNKCGSGIYLEDATEVDCVIEGNTVEDIWDINLGDWTLFPKQAGSVEGGMSGSGVYVSNPRNRVRNNTVRRAPYGIYYVTKGALVSNSVRFYGLDFDSNTAEQCHIGLSYVELGGEAQDSTFYRFKAKGCVFGVYPYPAWRIVADSFTLEDCTKVGWTSTDYDQRGGLKIISPTVTGCPIGVSSSGRVVGGEQLIEGGYFRNLVNIEVKQQTHNSGRADRILPRVTRIRGGRHEAMPGKPLKAIALTVLDNWNSRCLNLLVKDQVFVEDWSGVAGDNFRVFWEPYQRPEYLLPASRLPGFQGSPGPAPMTNADAMAQYGQAFHGEVVPPDATTRAGIVGLVKGA